jgi:hypothetical protein
MSIAESALNGEITGFARLLRGIKVGRNRRLTMLWFKRIFLCVGLIMSFVFIIVLITWGKITHWGQLAAGRAEWEARLWSTAFVIDNLKLYRPWVGARLEGPLLFHNQDGDPTYWKFLVRRGERIIGYVDVDAQNMVLVRFACLYTDPNDLSRCPWRFPDPPTTEEAIARAQEVLVRYPNAVVDKPFLFGVGGPEFWLIRIRRNGEVIAWVGVSVWGGKIWEIPPAYWESRADW